MKLTDDRTRRIFGIEISGLPYRYHTHSGNPFTTFDLDNAGDIPYVDSAMLSTISEYQGDIELSGGIGNYQQISVNLLVDRMRGSEVDPGVVFGRILRSTNVWKSNLVENISRSDATPTITVDREPAINGVVLTVPFPIYIGSETFIINSVTPNGNVYDLGCIQRIGPRQSHQILLNGTDVPIACSQPLYWRGRYVDIYVATQDENGVVENNQILHRCIIERSPEVDSKQVVLSLVPIVALLDNKLTSKTNVAKFAENQHWFKSKHKIFEIARCAFMPRSLDGATETYPFPQPDQQNRLLHSIIGYYINEDVVDKLLSNSDIQDRINRVLDPLGYGNHIISTPDNFTSIFCLDLKAFLSGGIGNYVFTMDTCYLSYYGLSGGGAGALSQFDSAMVDSMVYYQSEGGRRAVFSMNEVCSNNSVKTTTRVYLTDGLEANAVEIQTDELTRFGVCDFFDNAAENGITLSDSDVRRRGESTRYNSVTSSFVRQEYSDPIYYPDSGDLRDIFFMRTNVVPAAEGRYMSVKKLSEVKGIPTAWYEKYEDYILLEGDIDLPLTDEGSSRIVVIDTGVRRFPVKVTHKEAKGDYWLVYLDKSDPLTANLPTIKQFFGDDPIQVYYGLSIEDTDPGTAMLQILHSGGGQFVNNQYDTQGQGLNFPSSFVDEQSFLDISASNPLSRWKFTLRDADMTARDLLKDMLRSLGYALVMKRYEGAAPKLTVVPIGFEYGTDDLVEITDDDILVDPRPNFSVYDDVVTQYDVYYNHNKEEPDNAIYNDYAAINRLGGETRSMELQLQGIETNQIGGPTNTEIYNYFAPSIGRLLKLHGFPVRSWQFSIGTNKALLLDVGSRVKVTSQFLKGNEDSWGITSQVGMVRTINMGNQTASTSLEVIHYGFKTAVWNASMRWLSSNGSHTVTVQKDYYTSDDISLFEVGDFVKYHNAITGSVTSLKIESIDTVLNRITFTTVHGIVQAGSFAHSTYALNEGNTASTRAFIADTSSSLGVSGVSAYEYE
jgi:hypothetical protein